MQTITFKIYNMKTMKQLAILFSFVFAIWDGAYGQSAGPDQTLYCVTLPGGSVTMAATDTGVWTEEVGDPGTVNITHPDSANTTITTFSAPGVYRFLWTTAGGTDTMTVTVTDKPNAGPIQTVSCATLPGGFATMAATGAGTWTQMAGNPDTVTITTPTSPTTTITDFLSAGTYYFRWTNGSGCSDTSAVIVTAKPNAGPDQSLAAITDTATMAAIGTGTWAGNFAGNPGTATIISSTNPTTKITNFSAAGTYLFVWTANGCTDTALVIVGSGSTHSCGFQASQTSGCEGYMLNLTDTTTGSGHTANWTITMPTGCNPPFLYTYNNNLSSNAMICPGTVCVTMTDTINGQPCTANSCNITVYSPITASAGGNQTYCLPLSGVITLGGTPTATGGSGTYTYAWSPPTSLSSTSVSNPTVTISIVGTTTYHVLVTDVTHGCTAVDSMTLTIGPDISLSISTSPDSIITLGQPAVMTAGGSPAGGSYLWSPTVAMTPAVGNTATVSVSPAATQRYCVSYTVAACTTTSCQSIIVPHIDSAGPDQSICLGNTVTMAALGTGTWTALSSDPTSTTITTPSSPTTTISGFTASGTYGFIWAGDTTYVSVNATPPTPHLSVLGTCLGHDTLSVQGANGNAIGWLYEGGPWTPTPDDIPTVAGNYVVYAISACGVQSGISDTVLVYACTPDTTVWPGDADANHLVNNVDLLPIGLGYDTSGPVRVVQGIVWQADIASDWAYDFTNYAPSINFKNADCNGDGTINADDTLAIVTNYGLTHAKTANMPMPWRSGIPGITLAVSADTVLNGAVLTTTVSVGDSNLTVNGIYGLAFTLNYDPIVTDSNPSFAFIQSWLGDAGNSISIHKNFNSGQVQVAITGINHLSRSGYGKIAVFIGDITTGNINGKTMSYYPNIQYISDITAIDQYGNAIALNGGQDSSYVGFFVNGISTIDRPVVTIYPNPAATQVRVSADEAITSITITDMLGKDIQHIMANGKQSEIIDISRLANGIYTLHVAASGGTTTAKLIVSR